MWFQQDGATAHTSREQRAILRQHFTSLISLRSDLHWPARPPDLTPCNYFLWSYLKSVVHRNRPNNLDHHRNIMENIPVDSLERVEEKKG